MSPSYKAKSLGCKSLNQVADKTKQSPQTLINWHRNKPELFEAVCTGVAYMSKHDFLEMAKKAQG